MTTNPVIKKKICLLGSFGVGKTSLVRRFVFNVFDELYLSTLGVNVSQKDIPAEKGRPHLQFILWDIEGQEKFNAYTDNYFTGSAGAVLVLDITRKDSWEILQNLKQRFQKINPDAQFVLAANKVDLVPQDHASIKEVKALSKALNVDYFLTSAKDGRNVERFFHHLAARLSQGLKL